VKKKCTFVYCDNSDTKTIKKAKEDGHIIRCLGKFDGQIEPFEIGKVIICGHDKNGCKQHYEGRKIKVEMLKGSKSDKIEQPKPAPEAVKSSDTVKADAPEGEKADRAELIKQAKELGIKSPHNTKTESLIKKIQEAIDAQEDGEE